MSPQKHIGGRAAALPIENLDTDQIMPKQFLRGIDKSGLSEGLLYDLRFDTAGRPRPCFVLNQPEFSRVSVLIGGANFGCGSSREHAVWGLQQFGIRAVVAPSFAEIFYSNAMANGLLLVSLPRDTVERLAKAAADPATNAVSIDIERQSLHGDGVEAEFDLLPRHKRMFLEGLDVIGLTLTYLTYRERIQAFARQHWDAQPWLRDVAAHRSPPLRTEDRSSTEARSTDPS